jgi:hypothetical protein
MAAPQVEARALLREDKMYRHLETGVLGRDGQQWMMDMVGGLPWIAKEVGREDLRLRECLTDVDLHQVPGMVDIRMTDMEVAWLPSEMGLARRRGA